MKWSRILIALQVKPIAKQLLVFCESKIQVQALHFCPQKNQIHLYLVLLVAGIGLEPMTFGL